MKLTRLSLQIRIFLSMLLVVLFASIMIIGVTVFQYREQSRDYHKKRLERKVGAIQRDIAYQLDNATWLLNTENLKYIFRDKIYEISNIHGLEVNLYDFKGNLIKTSRASLVRDTTQKPIPRKILDLLKNSVEKHSLVETVNIGKKFYKSSYSYIYDNKSNPIGILNIPYIEESSFYQNELKDFLWKIFLVFLIVFFIAIIVAYFLSQYITHSIKTVIDKMHQTRLTHKNKKIQIKGGSKEIHNLLKAYNSMIDELEDSAVKLAQSERKQAWHEMAKQVAHEIKNPLTPMRLSVQNFQRRFDPKDPDATKKIGEFSQMIIQQIDTMTSIATAFADFAKMPTARKAPLDIVDVVKHAVDIFSEPYISFSSEKESIIVQLDKTQLVRIITNLVTNANQAVTDVENPKIDVYVIDIDKQVEIRVADNGKGISESVKDRVFEPKFTTKTSGMGLGLPMVKNIIEAYGGTVNFESVENKGTVFIVRFPKE